MQRKKFKAAIIGAGRIGATFDNPKSPSILTHAHALSAHKKTELVGFYDVDFRAAKKAAKIWGTKAYDDLRQFLSAENPDIISVCVPDQHHFTVLKEVVKHNPKIVLCEKPVTTTVADTSECIKMYTDKKIPVLINYSRRFDNSVQQLKKDLANNKFGKIFSAQLIYNKGILHNGSHAVDLARFLFGELIEGTPLYKNFDFNNQEPTLGAFLKFKSCPQFYLVAADARAYSIFELDIVCELGRIRLFDSGFSMSIQHRGKSSLYKNYTVLLQPKIEKTNLDKALFAMVNNAVEHLASGQELLCDINDALKTQIVCLGLLTK